VRHLRPTHDTARVAPRAEGRPRSLHDDQ
jgi:hypothetical protein